MKQLSQLVSTIPVSVGIIYKVYGSQLVYANVNVRLYTAACM